MRIKELTDYVQERKGTLLCVGPVSCNTVDASIELSNEKNVPLFLIASRRQVEIKEFGCGYANN